YQRGQQRQQNRAQRERDDPGAQQQPVPSAKRLGWSQQPGHPPDDIGACCLHGGSSTTAGGQDDQRSGQRASIAGPRRGVVGVQLSQQGQLRVSFAQQGDEGEHHMANPSRSHQKVVA